MGTSLHPCLPSPATMSSDTVMEFDDFEDEADSSPKLTRFNDQENSPPPRTFSKPVFGLPASGGHNSRPVTANSTFSELEEMDLDHAFLMPPPKGNALQPKSQTRKEASSTGQSYLQQQSPPWSPASNAIPTLDEYEEQPATPNEVSRLPIVSSGNHVAAAAAADVSDPSPRVADGGVTQSPTSSEKAKKDGCAVM